MRLISNINSPMNRLCLLLIVSLCFISKSFSADTKVRLRGCNFTGYEGNVIIYESGVGADCLRLKTFYVKLDQNGRFDTTITVNKPEYWVVGACNVYLVPGGNLEITYNASLKEYSFTGTTSKECLFLAKNSLNVYVELSFLDGGKNARKTFVETKRVIDSLASIRMRLLETSKNLDHNFVEIQKACTQAHVVNSYLNYYMFTPNYVKCNMGDEAETPEGKAYLESIRKYVEPLTMEFFNDRYFIDSDVRWIVERCKNGGLITVPKGSIWDQVYSVRRLMQKFENEKLGVVIAEAKQLLPNLTNEDLLSILKDEIEQRDVLSSGKPAFDFELEDIEGKRIDMNAYKGKAIYIDLWATWCGPCKKESPAFLQLKEKYPDVVFISISIDKNMTDWKKYLASKPKSNVVQGYSVNNESLMSKWSVKSVPRFILINKEYRIVDAFAPRPSELGIVKLLDQVL